VTAGMQLRRATTFSEFEADSLTPRCLLLPQST